MDTPVSRLRELVLECRSDGLDFDAAWGMALNALDEVDIDWRRVLEDELRPLWRVPFELGDDLEVDRELLDAMTATVARRRHLRRVVANPLV